MNENPYKAFRYEKELQQYSLLILGHANLLALGHAYGRITLFLGDSNASEIFILIGMKSSQEEDSFIKMELFFL